MALVLRPSRTTTLVLFLACSVGVDVGQVSRGFHRIFAVCTAEPVSLLVDLREGDLRIAYAREGEVSISVVPQDADQMDLDFLKARVAIVQSGNVLELRDRTVSDSQTVRLTYTLAVPYRTEIRSSVQRGNQTITGIMGPVNAQIGSGDIEASYISSGVRASAQTGNVSCEVVGGRIEARTGDGNINCQRAPLGVDAETGNGDISLAVVGPSAAVVKNGIGRVEIGGARGSLFASTTAGDLHVKAIPHDQWKLSSRSGTVRIALPPALGFELDAVTTSGEIRIRRDDLANPNPALRHVAEQANAGGKRVEVRTDSGNIVVQ